MVVTIGQVPKDDESTANEIYISPVLLSTSHALCQVNKREKDTCKLLIQGARCQHMYKNKHRKKENVKKEQTSSLPEKSSTLPK